MNTQPLDTEDQKTIIAGVGVIPYVKHPFYSRPPGWVLPGGRFTQDEAEARYAAEWIDKISREGSHEMA
jgi:hypothetical protein